MVKAMSNKEARWKKEIAKFDKKVKKEKVLNRKALNAVREYMGHTDGADNHLYSINSLSGDPNLERELKLWRKAIADFRKIGD